MVLPEWLLQRGISAPRIGSKDVAPGPKRSFPPRVWFGALRAEHRIASLVRAFALPSPPARSAPKVGNPRFGPDTTAFGWIGRLLCRDGWCFDRGLYFVNTAALMTFDWPKKAPLRPAPGRPPAGLPSPLACLRWAWGVG